MSVMHGPNDDSADLTNATKQWLADQYDYHGTSLADAQEAMRHRPPIGEYETRRNALHAAHAATGGDDIDRAERAFWDAVDYSKLGEADTTAGDGS